MNKRFERFDTAEERRDFTKLVNGTHADVQKFREYVLAELRCARKRAQLLICEIETIGIALSAGMVDSETALALMHEANALDFIMPAEPEWTREEATP